MLSLKYIRADPEKYIKNESARFRDPKIIDRILEMDKRWSRLNFIKEKNVTIKNMISGLLKKKVEGVGDSDNMEIIYGQLFEYLEKKQGGKAKELLGMYAEENGVDGLVRLGRYVDKISVDESELVGGERDKLVDSLCGLLHESVPIDNNEDNNVVVFCNGSGEKKLLGHVELGKKYKLIDTKRGAKIAGNRGYFLTGMGVRLNMALMMYAMDFLSDRGYTGMSVPHFMNGSVAEKLCQLQEYDETLYKLNTAETDPKYLIATSEQPLTGYYMDHKFAADELPVKLAGYSTCYRKETGRSGVDTLGIFRVHQFEKVEQLCITDEKGSWSMMEDMISISKEFYDTLGIKYRVINIVSGALNNAAAKKYDLEGYFASTGNYRELVSCSNCTDYFSRKLNIKDKHGNFVHILNSTLCANTRTICCLLEQHQTAEGILIPEVLRKYIHGYTDIYIR